MEGSVKQRLTQFIEEKKITKQLFEKEMGFSNGYVSSIRRSISPEKLERIKKAYPDLNPVWLLLGEGSMLRTETDNIPIVELKKPAPDTTDIPVFGFSEQKQRLITYINAKGLTKRQFENMAGLPNAYVAGIRQGITGKKLTQIKAAFPDLNPAWLMTGEGDMLRTDCDKKYIVDVKKTSSAASVVPILGTTQKKEEPIAINELLQQVIKQNNLLIQQNNQLQAQIQETLAILAKSLDKDGEGLHDINTRLQKTEDNNQIFTHFG